MTKTKGYRGVGMEGPVARWYAAITGQDDDALRGQVELVRRYAPETGDVLEVAPGPGYLSVAIARAGAYRVTGLDISETFVGIARSYAAEQGVDVEFGQGNASAMPFDDESFDLVVCCAAFKNFSEPVAALQEMFRVLRPGGVALVLDLRHDVTTAEVREEVAGMHLNAVNGAFTRWTLRHWLSRRAYTKAQFERMVARTQFPSVEVREDGVSLEVVMRR